MGFNVVLGGYMSIKRVAESIDSNMWIPADRNSVVTFCEAILRIFRDESDRKDRQQARVIWLVEKYGVENFKKAVIDEVQKYNRGVTIESKQPVPSEWDASFPRRELLGIHNQPQDGKVRAGILIPSGRLSVVEARQIADMADQYSSGEIRLTVEQNIILPNIDASKVTELLNEPALTDPKSRLKVNAGLIEGNMVSCTGSQFCGLGLIETKQNAEDIVKQLEHLVVVDRPIRIHFTGCPNSCGQVQVADIGIMGGPARKIMPDGKTMAVPGCKIFVGGRIGEDAHLALDPVKDKIPMEDLIPELVSIMKSEFGAKDKVQL
jgi:ferredoxin-nitrite reductase